MKKFLVFAFALMLALLVVPIFAAPMVPAAAEVVIAHAAPSVEAVIVRESGAIKAVLIFLSTLIAALILVLTYLVYLIRGRSVIATIENIPINSDAGPIHPTRPKPARQSPREPPAPATSAVKKRPGRKPKATVAGARPGSPSTVGDA